MNLSNEMVQYKDPVTKRTTRPNLEPTQNNNIGHHVEKIGDKNAKFQKKCFYCQHGHNPPQVRNTSYFCKECGKQYPLCAPTVRDCFLLHERHGMPPKRCFTKL